MGFFRDIYFDSKHLTQDLILLIKHPTRKATYNDISYAWSKLCSTVVFHPWYCLKRGIINMGNWFPLMWKTDVWDYCYLSEMMDKKLEEMEKFWAKQATEERLPGNGDTHQIGWRCQYRRIYKRIKWTRRLMEIWREEEYAMNWYKFHHTKFPERELFETDDSQTKYDKFGVPVLFTCKPMPEDERVHYISGSDKARLMDEKAFKLWHNNLRFIRHWWH